MITDTYYSVRVFLRPKRKGTKDGRDKPGSAQKEKSKKRVAASAVVEQRMKLRKGSSPPGAPEKSKKKGSEDQVPPEKPGKEQTKERKTGVSEEEGSETKGGARE